MPTAPNITLFPPNILATAQSSTLGIEIAVPSGGYLFGSVVLAYPTAEDLVGYSIMFNVMDAVQLKYGSTIYYKLDRNKIQFKEPPSI